MGTIIVIAVLAVIGYNVFLKGNHTKSSVLEDASKSVRTFRENLEPIKEQVVEASTKAKESYEAAQHQRRVDALVDDPELLADVLEARKAKATTTE